MTTTGKNRIMIYGPKNDGTYVVEFRTAAGRGAGNLYPRRRSTGDPVGPILACEEIPPALVIVAAAEAADQVSYAEGNGGGRVWALLYGCAEEVLSPAGAFANSFHGIRRRLLHLSVDILRCTFHLFCLALELTFYVAGSSPQFLFHPAADVFGITDNAIFVHERGPSEIQDFNGWNGRRVPLSPRSPKPKTSRDFE